MQERPKRSISRWVVIIIILLAVIFLLFRGCKKDKTLKTGTITVQPRTIIETVDENGRVYPLQEMKITAEPGSLVEELYVREGDTVTKGQLLAIVKTEQYSTSATAAATPDLQKLGGGNLDPAAIAQMLKNSQQPVAPTVKRQARQWRITAPMAGIVSNLAYKAGERLPAGELGRVISAGLWEVRVDVGEADIVKVEEGNPVTLEADAFPGKKFPGTVQRIASGSNSQQGGIPGNLLGDVSSYKVYIAIEPAALDVLKQGDTSRRTTLRSGMNIRVNIQTRRRENVLAVPINAVTTRVPDSLVSNREAAYGDKVAQPDVVVFTYDKGIVHMKKVSTGIQDINYIEVTGGLSAGETVINEPYDAIQKTLKEGMKVKAVKENELFKKQ